MIINGIHAFVGSNKNLAKKYVDQYLQVFSGNKITLSIRDDGINQIEVSYQCPEWTADSVLNIALVEDNLESKPIRGGKRRMPTKTCECCQRIQNGFF